MNLYLADSHGRIQGARGVAPDRRCSRSIRLLFLRIRYCSRITPILSIPATVIRYGLPARSDVTLTVYNTLGQRVALLVRETQERGYHQVNFDGAGLSSGVYFYRLQAGSSVATKRMILLK